jgi:riboflavin synthase
MFTGIIQAIGRVEALEPRGDDIRLRLDAGRLALADVRLGDSIAVSGICLTVIERRGLELSFDVSLETLGRTALDGLKTGDRVNLEKALTLATPLGGHLVSGHVDGVGEVLSRTPSARSVQFRIKAPDSLARYIAEKGSICVDGVSLTVNGVDGASFEVNIIPHTLEQTTLGDFQPGRCVNLEVDIVARYLERLLGERAVQLGDDRGGITRELLATYGYIGGETD